MWAPAVGGRAFLFEDVEGGICLNDSGGWDIAGSRYSDEIVIRGNSFDNAMMAVNIWGANGESSPDCSGGFPQNPPDKRYFSHPHDATTGGVATVVGDRACSPSSPCTTVTLSRAPAIDDDDVTHDYAVLRADKRVEIRFVLRPYTRDTPQLVRTGKGAWAFFETGIMNLTHLGTTGEAGRAKALAAASYGADDARIVLVRWAPSDDKPTFFGNGYRYAVVIFLHRKDVGDVYEFFLLRDRDAAQQVSERLLHSLRFAPEQRHPERPSR